MYDVDPGTLSPDLDSLTAALTAGARLVVVTSLYGVPVQWRAVLECAAAVGAAVIEDAAQGFGASWLGRPLGSLGAVSVLSFGRGKGWTGGRGGALLARGRAPPSAANGNGAGLWREVEVLALAAAQWAFARPAAYGLPAALPWLGLGETRYRDPVAPRPLPRAAAGLLLRGFPDAQREAAERNHRPVRRPGICGCRCGWRVAWEGSPTRRWLRVSEPPAPTRRPSAPWQRSARVSSGRRGAGRGPKSSCGTWSRSPHTPCSASGTSKR